MKDCLFQAYAASEKPRQHSAYHAPRLGRSGTRSSQNPIAALFKESILLSNGHNHPVMCSVYVVPGTRSSQKATAAAAATFRESTSRAMGMITR